MPVTQAMQLFTALQLQGTPSQFLYFPDEGHWILKPRNSIYWHETVIDWLKRWIDQPYSKPRRRQAEPAAESQPAVP